MGREVRGMEKLNFIRLGDFMRQVLAGAGKGRIAGLLARTGGPPMQAQCGRSAYAGKAQGAGCREQLPHLLGKLIVLWRGRPLTREGEGPECLNWGTLYPAWMEGDQSDAGWALGKPLPN